MPRPQNKRKKQSESDVSDSMSDSGDSGEEEVVPLKKARAPAKKPAATKKAASDEGSDENGSPKKLDKPSAAKKAAADSDSDSGPDDKNPVPKKGGKAVSTKTVEKNGEVHWELEKNKRFSISEFKGRTLLQIREYYEKDGQMQPGRKGITLSLNMWKTLKDLAPEIDEVLEEKK